MKKTLDLMSVARVLLMDSTDFALIRYIFRVQGGELKRLDYEAAAKALLCDRKTVSRRVKALSNPDLPPERQILQVCGGKLKINDDLLKDKAV